MWRGFISGSMVVEGKAVHNNPDCFIALARMYSISALLMDQRLSNCIRVKGYAHRKHLLSCTWSASAAGTDIRDREAR